MNSNTPSPSPSPSFTVIAAYDQANRGIGYQNRLVWHVPEDLRFFREKTQWVQDTTKQNAVILGRRTLESFQGRLLPRRFHVCLSSSTTPSPPYPDPTRLLYTTSLDQALDQLSRMPHIESIYVIGGAQVYQEALRHPGCAHIWVNELEFTSSNDRVYDAFFPFNNSEMYQECPNDLCSSDVAASAFLRRPSPTNQIKKSPNNLVRRIQTRHFQRIYPPHIHTNTCQHG